MATTNPPGYYNVPLHGRYYQPASLGRLFGGGNQAPVVTALPNGLTASYTGGLVLYNPIASTVNISLLQANYAVVVQQTNAVVIGIGTGYSASVAPTGTLTVVTSQPANVGSSATPQGILYSSATITLPTVPYFARIISPLATGALTADQSGGGSNFEAAGQVLLPPGGYAAFISLGGAGTASSFVGHFAWEEIPVGAL